MQNESLSEADQFLLDQIRSGDADGWSQLVERYRGRLVAFAKQRVANAADAEDIVQEAFIGFLSGLNQFRGEASLETYLFTILRRRIIDAYRIRKLNVCRLTTTGAADDSNPGMQLQSPDATASWYARRDEAYDASMHSLRQALAALLESYKKTEQFENIILIEAIFYAQLRNIDAAELTGIEEKQVALKKHRWINQLKSRIETAPTDAAATAIWDSPEIATGMIGQIWEAHRLSCPKRSTLGRFTLGTLDEAWHDYITFHVERLGCSFCQANLQDLNDDNVVQSQPAMHERIMQSTIGFFRHSTF